MEYVDIIKTPRGLELITARAYTVQDFDPDMPQHLNQKAGLYSRHGKQGQNSFTYPPITFLMVKSIVHTQKAIPQTRSGCMGKASFRVKKMFLKLQISISSSVQPGSMVKKAAILCTPCVVCLEKEKS